MRLLALVLMLAQNQGDNKSTKMKGKMMNWGAIQANNILDFTYYNAKASLKISMIKRPT